MPFIILDQLAAQMMQHANQTLLWVVTDNDPRHVGYFVARPHTGNRSACEELEAVLLTKSLPLLRAMLPKGLTPRPRGSFWPSKRLEMWSEG